MPVENRKFLWIAIALAIFVIILVVAGLFIFKPADQGNGYGTENTLNPKSADPQDYLVGAPPAPTTEGTIVSGDSYVVYGTPMEPSSTTVQKTSGGSTFGSSSSTTTVSPYGPQPGTTTTSVRSTASNSVPTSTTTTQPFQFTPVMPPPDQPIVNESTTTTTIRRATTTTVRRVVAAPKPAPKPRPVTTTTIRRTSTTVIPRPTAQANDDGIAWIQVGSFSSRETADALKNEFSRAGIGSVLMVNDIDGKSWYRVRVGPFSGKAQAGEWLNRAKAVPGASRNSFVTSD